MSRQHPLPAGKQWRSTDRWHNREGTVLVLSAFLIIVMLAFLAFTVDLGYMYTLQTEIDRAVDAAALAGAGALIDGEEEARLQSLDYMSFEIIHIITKNIMKLGYSYRAVCILNIKVDSVAILRIKNNFK